MRASLQTVLLSFLVTLSAAQPLVADTYDVKTLVEIRIAEEHQIELLYRQGTEIVGRKGGTWRALVKNHELEDLEQRGLLIEILFDEMDRDRQLWAAARSADEYYTASPFDTVDPPAGSLMAHLLELHQAHPEVTRLYDIGDSSSRTYDIIAMQVSKNPDAVETEPKMRIYATIHGDEQGAMMVATDVLDWILANYPADPVASKLVDEAELWFIPMGNPEGVASFSRYNDNQVDLNRNFDGPEGCSESPCFSEPETRAIRDLTEVMGKRFAISVSMHGGAICFNAVHNYTLTPTSDEPIFFTSWSGGPEDEALPSPHGLAKAYQDGNTTPGFWYTNGANWYKTWGDTNDWSYAYWSDLDTTLEVTYQKTPPASEIPVYTAEHQQAVLNYLLKTFQGIHGVMTDQVSQAPLDGWVSVTATASEEIPVPHPYQAVLTDPLAGDFHRVLQPGTYSILCEAPYHLPTEITGIEVLPDTPTLVDCPMSATAIEYVDNSLSDAWHTGGSGGDGTFDDEGAATIEVTLRNPGFSAATRVSAFLACSIPGIEILQAKATFPDLPGGGFATSSPPHFRVRADRQIPRGKMIPFDLHMVADQGTWDASFEVEVGRLRE